MRAKCINFWLFQNLFLVVVWRCFCGSIDGLGVWLCVACLQIKSLNLSRWQGADVCLPFLFPCSPLPCLALENGHGEHHDWEINFVKINTRTSAVDDYPHGSPNACKTGWELVLFDRLKVLLLFLFAPNFPAFLRSQPANVVSKGLAGSSS